jgi:hypothetical protein
MWNKSYNRRERAGSWDIESVLAINNVVSKTASIVHAETYAKTVVAG